MNEEERIEKAKKIFREAMRAAEDEIKKLGVTVKINNFGIDFIAFPNCENEINFNLLAD